MDDCYQQHEEAARQIQNVGHSTKQLCETLQKANVMWKQGWGIHPKTKEIEPRCVNLGWILDWTKQKTAKNK